FRRSPPARFSLLPKSGRGVAAAPRVFTPKAPSVVAMMPVAPVMAVPGGIPLVQPVEVMPVGVAHPVIRAARVPAAKIVVMVQPARHVGPELADDLAFVHHDRETGSVCLGARRVESEQAEAEEQCREKLFHILPPQRHRSRAG